ncbi:Drug/metabolite transporter protein [Quillaja saponaria]|uniref:Drug/metabolite transporter protein n=1 Tax=Quillaja saponaria TaxID=32244 RepID=A0AAD7P5N0_QUISA|nr:Drug/metabolite transporter protein [Quillaja saponaria]
MATQSHCRWSWRRTSYYDTIKLSPPSCFSAYNASFLYSFHIAYTKRHRFTTFSLHNSSSSNNPTTPGSGSRRRKSIKLEGLKSEQLGDDEKKEVPLASSTQIQTHKRGALSFKSLFGKRSLWRRIFFASKKVRSIILLNVIAVVYASNIPVVKEVEAIMDPATFTVVRFVSSTIPFIPFVLHARGDVHTRNAGIELGIWVSLGYLMQALGLLTSDAGRASFISMLTVIVVPLLDGMLGAVVPARIWFGALMSIVGVAMLESSGSPPSVGDILNFFSAVFFGVHMLRTEHISRSTKKENFLPLLGYEVCVVALSSTLWYFLGGCLDDVPQSWPSSWTWTMVWDWMVAFPWIPTLYTGVFSTGLCLWVEMAAMRDVSATETAIIYGLEPVWGASFAWFLLGERWGVTGWIGAALVLGGSLTVQIFGSSSPSKSLKDREESKENGNLLVADKQSSFSASPVIVSSRKDITNLPKK